MDGCNDELNKSAACVTYSCEVVETLHIIDGELIFSILACYCSVWSRKVSEGTTFFIEI